MLEQHLAEPRLQPLALERLAIRGPGRQGGFTSSKYNANYRVGYKTGTNPFVQSPYGPSVTDDTKAAIAKAKDEISKPGGTSKRAPIKAGRRDKSCRRPGSARGSLRSGLSGK